VSDVLYFILFLGGLIFFHELGHYLAARAVGVTVLRFSIGFGPRILGFKRGTTEYWLSALPLGGYVKFLGDDPEDPPPAGELKRGFLTTSLWRKIVIVVAGPAFNLVLPLLVFLPMHALESELQPAVLGTVSADGPAGQAGLRVEDRITAIDGSDVRYWWEMLRQVSDNPGRPLVFTVEREGRTLEVTVTPKPVEFATFRELGLVETVGRIDVAPERTRPVAVVAQGSPAADAGLLDFDAILEVDGREPLSWADVATALDGTASRPVRLKVASVDESEDDGLGEPMTVLLGPLGSERSPGLSDAEFVLAVVDPDSPIGRAGALAGDRVVSLDGRTYSDWSFLVQALSRDPAATHEMTLDSGGAPYTVQLSFLNPKWTPGAAVPKYERFGARTCRSSVVPDPIPNESRLRYSWYRSTTRTREIFYTTVAGIYGLITGKVSIKEMGGPIMIYDIASSAGQKGWPEFLAALAWLSMSLGVLNLLPIPVLDGGHLLIFAIETIRRKPLGRKGRQIVTYLGMAFLVMLMAVVFANDIQRKWGGLGE
jgi:regulator of sigma E protease